MFYISWNRQVSIDFATGCQSRNSANYAENTFLNTDLPTDKVVVNKFIIADFLSAVATPKQISKNLLTTE